MFAIIVHHKVWINTCSLRVLPEETWQISRNPSSPALHGFADTAGSAVVGAHRKRPAIVDVVELSQVAGGVVRGKT